jgi:hypothetical protein
MPAAHSLLLQACSGCSMGTGFAQQQQHTLSVGNLDTAVPGCPGTLRTQGHAVLPTRLQQVLLQACAHLFVTATEF